MSCDLISVFTALQKNRISYKTLNPDTQFLLAYPDLYDQVFYQTNTFVIAIPPKDDYMETLHTILPFLPDSTQIILLSSISVYPHSEGIVTEKITDTITTPTHMLQAENLVRSMRKDVLILRLGGLMGYDRIAGSYTAGTTKTHDKPVNYVHRDDVVAVIARCIEQDYRADVFNVVAPLHPRQSLLYAKNAKIFGWEATSYASQTSKGHIVSSDKLIKTLPYTFLKPDPLAFWE